VSNSELETLFRCDETAVQPLDPFHVSVPLRRRATYYPMGFPVEFESNSPEILQIAEETWGHWPRRFNTKPIVIRCVMEPAVEDRPFPPPPTLRVQGNLLTITADAENFAACDLERGFACAWFTPATLADRPYFRYLFLDCMVYALLECLHLLSIHAACVLRNGCGVLLAGESGAGKSSLSYACARRGWTFVTDDQSALVRFLNERTVLGDSRHFRFRESAGDLFPEFRGMRATSQRPSSGKPTVEVMTEMLPAIQTALESPVTFIVFLNRGSDPRRPTRLDPFDDEAEAGRRLFYDIWPHDLFSHGVRLEALKRLLDQPMFELHYCRLDAAVDTLNELVDGI
jgi:hypothetical protein